MSGWPGAHHYTDILHGGAFKIAEIAEVYGHNDAVIDVNVTCQEPIRGIAFQLRNLFRPSRDRDVYRPGPRSPTDVRRHLERALSNCRGTVRVGDAGATVYVPLDELCRCLERSLIRGGVLVEVARVVERMNRRLVEPAEPEVRHCLEVVGYRLDWDELDAWEAAGVLALGD